MTEEHSWATASLKEAPFWREDMTPEEYDTERLFLIENWDAYKRGCYRPLWMEKQVVKMSLEAIRVEQSIARAEYHPENGTEAGRIAVRLPEGTVLTRTEAPGYESFYAEQAIKSLVKLANEGDRRKEVLIVWHRRIP